MNRHTYGQNDPNGDIMRRKVKSVLSVVETEVAVLRCDHHGNVWHDSLKVKLHFDVHNQLLIAERLFSTAGRFAHYFFTSGILVLISRNNEDGDIIEMPYRDQISFICLNNFDGSFVKAVLDKLQEVPNFKPIR